MAILDPFNSEVAIVSLQVGVDRYTYKALHLNCFASGYGHEGWSLIELTKTIDSEVCEECERRLSEPSPFSATMFVARQSTIDGDVHKLVHPACFDALLKEGWEWDSICQTVPQVECDRCGEVTSAE